MVIALLSPEEVLTALMKATTDCLGSRAAFLRLLTFISLSSFSMFYYCEISKMPRLKIHKGWEKKQTKKTPSAEAQEKKMQCNAT